MIPFLKGQAYRGITLQYSYFYQVIRPPEDAHVAEGINGRNVYFIHELHNYGTAPITVTFEFTFEIWVYDPVTQTWGPTTPALSGVTASQVVTIPAGTTVRIVNPKVATIPAIYPFCTWFAIHLDFHWTFTFGNHVWQGRWEEGRFDCPNYWTFLVHFHPGDHFGKTPLPLAGGYWDELNDYSARYLAANGLVNIGDVGPITAHWQKTIPPNMGNVEYPALSYDIGINDNSGITKRADGDGNNIIAIGDVGLITANWQKTWTDTPPAFPTVGP